MTLMENYYSSRDNSKKISWSKNGFIAYSLPYFDCNLYITYLESTEDSRWQLARPKGYCIQPSSDFSSLVPEISLLSWSNTGTDLFVTDLQGNITILLSGIYASNSYTAGHNNSSTGLLQMCSYNQMYSIYHDNIPFPVTNIDDSPFKVIGFKWLNVEKPLITNKPTVKGENDGVLFYNYGVSQYAPFGTMHPISSKHASILVRRNGEITLLYQAEHGVEYRKSSTYLESSPQEQEWITYSSIGFQKNGIVIIAVYSDVTRNLKVYSVSIDWNYLAVSAKSQKEDPNYTTPDTSLIPPKLHIKRITRRIVNDLNQNLETCILSGIEIISPNYNGDSKLDILLICQNQLENHTEIHRYQLDEQIMPLHESFKSLEGRHNSVSDELKQKVSKDSTKQLFLKLKDSLNYTKSILSIVPIGMDTQLNIVFKDGSIDIVNRKSMKSTYQAKDITTPPQAILTLSDAGFTLTPPPFAPYFICISPNTCSYVSIPVDFHNKKLTQLYFRLAERISIPEENMSYLQFTAAAFADRHSLVCYTNANGEDIVATIMSELKRIKQITNEETSRKLMNLILHESHKAINFSLDVYTREQVDKLLSNPPLQRLLSLQMSLGRCVDGENTISGRISWALMNLRGVSFAIMFTMSTLSRHLAKRKPNQETLQLSQWKSELLFVILGVIRWLLDFIILLNQELLELNSFKNDPDYTARLNKSTVLPILLGKVPRALLIYSITSVKKTNEIISKLISELVECNRLYAPLKESHNRFSQNLSNSPVKLEDFEKFLIIVENVSRTLKLDKTISLQIEQELVCKGTIPAQLSGVSMKILELYEKNSAKEIDLSELYFFDVDWIKLRTTNPKTSKCTNETSVDKSTTETQDEEKRATGDHSVINLNPVEHNTQNEEVIIDVLRKVKLSKNSQKRKCVKCGSISASYETEAFEDIIQLGGFWTMAFQRNCICGGNWVAIL